MDALKDGHGRCGIRLEQSGVQAWIRTNSGEMPMKSEQTIGTSATSKGFTLIELVVTISIIAILAAVALPRYITLQSQAREAKMRAIYGGVRSAAALAHAQALATNISLSGAAVVPMEGANVTLIHGYPTANAAGIVAALQLNASNDQVAISAGSAAASGVITIDIVGGTVPNCAVVYSAPNAPSTGPAITATASPTGC
jgi:MSHA pilin protein MshA